MSTGVERARPLCRTNPARPPGTPSQPSALGFPAVVVGGGRSTIVSASRVRRLAMRFFCVPFPV